MRVSDRYYNRIIRDSKTSDKKQHFRIGDTYITAADILRMQNEQQNRCAYCGIFLNWLERRRNRDGLTVERLDTSRPHEVDNCCLVCKRCNSKRMTPEKKILTKYFYRWYRATFDFPSYVETNRVCSFLS